MFNKKYKKSQVRFEYDRWQSLDPLIDRELILDSFVDRIK